MYTEFQDTVCRRIPKYKQVCCQLFVDAATAGKICIAEVEEIVPVGQLDPDNIHVPSCYVDRIVKVEDETKRIEFRTISKPGE